MISRISGISLYTCLFLVLLLAGCRQKEKSGSDTGTGNRIPEVAFVTNGIASFWVICRAGCLAAAKDLNVKCDVRMPTEGIVDQKRIIEDLLVRGVDGIALSPIDPGNQRALINAACEKTRLITADSDAPGTRRLCYVGMDNYKAGRMTGELVREAMPEGGSVIILIGRLGQDNARRRRQGVIDELLDRAYNPGNYDEPGRELKGEKYTVLDTRLDNFDFTKAKSNAEDAITRYPDLGCMVGLFAYNPPACLLAVKEAGKLGKIKLVSFDEADEALQGIKDGHIYGTVVQDPFNYGYHSVRILAALARGDTTVIPEGGFLDIPARKIKRDNLDAFWSDLKVRMGNKGS
jgi:ribose transport system substrate-binding protein